MRSLDPSTLAAHVDARVMDRWRRAAPGELAALGRRIRSLGLTERALYHCFGVTCPIHAPERARVQRLAGAAGEPRPAALMAHLWVAGEPLPESRARAYLGDDFQRLCDLGLLISERGQTHATITLLPIGDALIASDRPDLHRFEHLTSLADDSAYHTIGMIPARAHRPGQTTWLDVGTGSAIIPLARPGAATHIHATDINPRSVAMAALGVALSGARSIDLSVADLLHNVPLRAPWDLITFNAPVPDGATPRLPPGSSTYFRGAPDILTRFWADVRQLIAPTGEVLVHSILPDDPDYPATLDLPGRTITAQYTPPGTSPAFGITWWRPGGTGRSLRIHVPLHDDHSHTTRAALEDLLTDR